MPSQVYDSSGDRVKMATDVEINHSAPLWDNFCNVLKVFISSTTTLLTCCSKSVSRHVAQRPARRDGRLQAAAGKRRKDEVVGAHLAP
eukprot:6208993-Pleurochrysis_carterae.AAC.3